MRNLSDISIQYMKGVGPARKKLFENLGVETIEDLFYLFPRRYEDRRKLTQIKDLKLGEWQTVTGMVLAKGGRRTYFNKKHKFEITVGDDDASILCVWFNQPYLDRYFNVGDRVVLYGRPEVFNKRIQIISPEYEVISGEDEKLNMGRIVPIYPLTKGMTQRYLRKVVHAALELYGREVRDVLPTEVRARGGLWGILDSLKALHFPDDENAQKEANRRVSFDEFFLFQISVMLRRMSIIQKTGFAHKIGPSVIADFEKSFPFTLTNAQKRVIQEISRDMMAPRPMLRLLQGDVGSGKTVVSFFGCLVAFLNGHQAAVMAPTEILAEQHYATFAKFFGKMGCRPERSEGPPSLGILRPVGAQDDGRRIRTALLNSSLKKKDREEAYAAIKAGEVDIIFGTHAVIQEGLVFKDLSFVVVDEQHKFGVKQRALLSSKGENPDVLVMTATPIPRTLCLTLYGDLDISVIDEKPKGRGETKTYLFPEDQADSVYKRVAEWITKGTQAYIVYPIIEESEKLDLKAAKAMYEHFCKHEFKDLKVGLIHGRLDREETQGIMQKYQRGEIDILVTTTVLEVGIDVPNANIMVIEHAERFGLAQLHQLRGRIGRGEKSAVCILLGDALTEEGQQRLEAIVKTTNGFTIAEEDLKIRGPGQYFGRSQHGINELRIVNPLTQLHVLEAARKEAAGLVQKDSALAGANHRLIRETIRRRYPEYLERVLAG
jgi:ATP-dependent DNA helicase RecG